ncbi:EcsC family protein [Anaerosacchariphilus polymeriproducens]|uniref:EcsC family protein n=1 Tax=Anaerosacchariphilus polymeriproducens TaxID=1812858 RepID=A0A371AS27_9FIRM|nr:EcsC family protein [Anaerosacchariphilus polymeriproducens]RDU22373.1 EcsC family protein [Anaerosacchariphilus polymeriproducens]
MKKRKKQAIWEREWELLEKKENLLLIKYQKEKASVINKKLEAIVPYKLQEKLDLAFYKAFQLVFEKGTKIIEMTYSKEKQENDYKIRAYSANIRKNKKSVKAFSKQAGIVNLRNLMFSGIEGIGLGALGVGIPDIPLFAGLIIKSMNEIALSYGFPYDTDKERIFILKLVETALYRGEEFKNADANIIQLIEGSRSIENDLSEQIRFTANALSKEMLYMKFLQGIPIAGIVGGLTDAVYLKRITDYAELKYRRRFFQEKIRVSKV